MPRLLGGEDSDGLVRTVVKECFDPLLRKYMEDAHGIYVARPHADLDSVLDSLRGALWVFLLGTSPDQGCLRQWLAAPLGDDGGFFPDNGMPQDPVEISSDPAEDIYRLGLTVNAADDGPTFKRKLIEFVRHDPWLFAEHEAFVKERLRDTEGKPWARDDAVEADSATDEFLFRATRLAGLSPVQLLLARQRHLTEEQRQRFLRWDTETFFGAFRVLSVEPPFVWAEELGNSKAYCIECMRPDVASAFPLGCVVLSRINPWGDHWLFSGIQRILQQLTEEQLSKLTRDLQKPGSRPLADDDPRVQQGFETQYKFHAAWMDFFGDEEALFATGVELEAAINSFYRYWAEGITSADSGTTRAEQFRERFGRPYVPPRTSLPPALRRATDVGVVFDREHGQAYYVGYRLFRSAFEQDGPPTPEQLERVWEYLESPSVDYWLFQRMRHRFPERVECVLRDVLKDQEFELGRDFDALLGKFKGQAMRQPRRPMIALVDLPDDL